MLVIHGLADLLINPTGTKNAVKSICNTYPDSALHFALYPRLSHDESFQADQPDYFKWIKERFDGKPAHRGCTNETAKPASQEYSTIQQYWRRNVLSL